MSFFTETQSKIFKDKKLVFFGSGSAAEKYYTNLVKYYGYDEIHISYFVDNNPLKWNKTLFGKNIYSPNVLVKDREDVIILIASQFVEEISVQLQEMKFLKNKDFFEIEDLTEEIIIHESEKFTDEKIESKNSRRILFDMSYVALVDANTGIARVVKNLVTEGYRQKEYEFIAVQRVKDTLVEPTEWLVGKNILDHSFKSKWRKIVPMRGDILLLGDSIWNSYSRYEDIIKGIRQVGGKVYNIIYDLLPIKYPEKFDEANENAFSKMLPKILSESDGVICISKVVADDFINYTSLNINLLNSHFSVGWFHIGTNLIISHNNENEGKVRDILSGNFFLTVGTIEPRKGHATALDAFELLWEKGYDYTLCFAGKVGWKVDVLMNRILKHKEFGKRLVFLNFPTDDELIYCYNNARALVFPSMDEGFGLPIIEAAQFGLPLILSDIPIFREIAGQNAVYFNVNNAESLYEAILRWQGLSDRGQVPNSSNISFNSWEKSLKQIFEIVFRDKWYKVF